jgi:hypothetical protein
MSSTGTVASSACSRSAASTCVRIALTSGISVAVAAPTQSVRVETSSATPSRAKVVLAGKRQMQPVLAEQHVRQQPGTGPAAGDGMRRRRRLRDRLTGRASVLLAHMLDHLPLARHQLQHLGHVLAQLAERAAAARAGRGNRIDQAFAWQVFRQRPAGRLAARERLHRHTVRRDQVCLGLGLGVLFLELEQLQFELIQQRAAPTTARSAVGAAGRWSA